MRTWIWSTDTRQRVKIVGGEAALFDAELLQKVIDSNAEVEASTGRNHLHRVHLRRSQMLAPEAGVYRSTRQHANAACVAARLAARGCIGEEVKVGNQLAAVRGDQILVAIRPLKTVTRSIPHAVGMS